MTKNETQNTKKAVMRIGGKQYLVSENEELLVEKLNEESKAEVLAIIEGDSIEIGQPVLEKNKITFKVLEEKKLGEKIRVFKYKAKSRYHKTKGFRPQFTKILIEKIA